jgi:hypothetical protein
MGDPVTRDLVYAKIFESYVGKGAPSNAAGSRVGYGLTKEQAHENAGHWANQAAWAKTRKVAVSDVSKPGGMTSRDEKIAWEVCGIPDEYVPATKVQKECADLIGKGRYATAILKALSK